MSSKKADSVLDNIFNKKICNAPLEPKSTALPAIDEVKEQFLPVLEAQAESSDIRSGHQSTDISISTTKVKSSKKRTNQQKIEEINKKISTESEELI